MLSDIFELPELFPVNQLQPTINWLIDWSEVFHAISSIAAR